MTQPIRVKILTGLFYPAIGGAEHQALLLGKTLAAKGVEVSIITTRYDKSLPVSELIERLPVTRVFFSERFRFGRIGLPLYAAALLLELFKSRRKFDILHVHGMRQHAAMGLVAAKVLKKKAIVKAGSLGPAGDIQVLKDVLRYGRICLKICRHFDRFVALRYELQTEMERNGFSSKRIVNIPNGVDIKYFSPPASTVEKLALRKRLKLPDKVTLCFTGRLSSVKKIDDLLKAMRSLQDLKMSSQLLIIGDGPERGHLELMTHKLRLSDCVLFKGFCDNIRDWLLVSDIFVMCTHFEGMSNSLLEAMSCGLALVVTRGSGSMITGGKNGTLVENGNVSELSSKLAYLIRHPELRLSYGHAAREIVIKEYSIETIAESYIGLYKELLTERYS